MRKNERRLFANGKVGRAGCSSAQLEPKTTNNQHPTTNIEHPTTNIRDTASNAEHPTGRPAPGRWGLDGSARKNCRGNERFLQRQLPWLRWTMRDPNPRDKKRSGRIIIQNYRTGNRSVDICGIIEHHLHHSRRASKWPEFQRLTNRKRLTVAGDKSRLVIVFALAICVTGCRTPRWVKFRADQSNTGTFSVTNSLSEGKLQWEFNPEAGGVGGSAAIDSDGRVFVPLGARLYLIDPSGQPKCDFQAGGRIFSSPRLEGVQRALFGSDDGNFYSINTLRCEQVSSFKAAGPIKSSPVVVGDKAFFASVDGTVYSVGLGAAPKPRWQYSVGAPIRSSPAYAPGARLIVIGSDNHKVYAFDRDKGGSGPKWVFTANAKIPGPPSVARFRDHEVVVVGVDTESSAIPVRVYAILDTGSELWHYDVSAGIAVQGVAITPYGKVFFGTASSEVVCLDLISGQLIWKVAVAGGDVVLGAPAVSSNGIVYIGGSRALYAIDAASGAIKWKFAPIGEIPVEAPPAIARDGTVYIGDMDGHFYAIR
jgi:outer membrane protein assembly factor BamB